VTCFLPACAHFTKAGRQQLAYEHYVRKQSHTRIKMVKKFKKVKIPTANASGPRISGTVEGPQSVSAAPSAPAQPQAPVSSEPENQ
jgi:hypothetical protein